MSEVFPEFDERFRADLEDLYRKCCRGCEHTDHPGFIVVGENEQGIDPGMYVWNGTEYEKSDVDLEGLS